MNKKIRVVFLTFYYEAWDALSEIHRLMLSDERFEVSVVAIDRRLTGGVGYGGANVVSAFFDELGVEHLVNADLASLEPDFIFVNYPWQRNYEPRYRPDALARIARVAYVPYFSLPLVKEPVDGRTPESGFSDVAAHLYTQRMHLIASLNFVQDAETRDAYAGESRGAEHVYVVGTPKLDALVAGVDQLASVAAASAQKASLQKTLLWAPHHSYSPHWLNFGNFAATCHSMLAWAKAHPEVQVILRPHPFMFGTLIDRKVMEPDDLDAWIASWSALPSTQIELELPVTSLFANADYLLTDGISFLAEWPLSTGKPAIFLENPNHWPFTHLGEMCSDAALKITSTDNLAAALSGELSEAIAQADALEKSAAFEEKLANLKQVAMPYAGKTAEKIVEIVAANTNVPLVNPDLITDLAWELQPGREPLGDE